MHAATLLVLVVGLVMSVTTVYSSTLYDSHNMLALPITMPNSGASQHHCVQLSTS
jgi:hypothetical protein